MIAPPAPEKPRRRWLWLLLFLVPCVPVTGVCGALFSRKTGADKERRSAAERTLSRLERFARDAGRYPADLGELGDAPSGVSYARCPDGGFEVEYLEAEVGMLPSDFARRWDPQARIWRLVELGVDPSCR